MDTLGAEPWSVADTEFRFRSADQDGTAVRSRPNSTAHRGRTARRALPGTRALAGGFFVALAAIALFGALTRSNTANLRPVTVAAHDLTAGQPIGPDDVRVIPMDLPADVGTRTFADLRSLQGRTLIGPVGEGEVIQRSSVLGQGLTPVFRELTVSVDASQLRALHEGDTTDVLVSIGSGDGSRTEVAASGARVLQLPKSTGSIGDKPAVTLGLPTFDAVYRVVQAAHAGSITLVRSTGFPTQPATFSPPAPAGTKVP